MVDGAADPQEPSRRADPRAAGPETVLARTGAALARPKREGDGSVMATHDPVGAKTTGGAL